MKNQRLLILVVVLGIAQAANAAWLRMQWRGLGPDEAEIELAPGERAIIDIYYELYYAEETLGALSFKNIDTATVTQTETEALLPGWMDHSVDGPFGSDEQFVEWVADPGAHLTGPGEFLIGSQTIEHNWTTAGELLPITFAYDFMDPVDDTGESYFYAPSVHVVPGVFGVGLGKPKSAGSFEVDWNPLYIVTVPEPAGLGLLTIGAIAAICRRVGYEMVRKERLGSG